MADLPSGDESESDELDPVKPPSNTSDGDDQVVGSLVREELTQLPSVEREERYSRALADSNATVAVPQTQVQCFVDEEALQEVELVVRDPGRRVTWVLPKNKIVHCAFKDRAGQTMPYLTIKASSFVDFTPQRATVTKTLINEHGAAAVAERCVFVECTTKPGGVFCVIPVNVTHVEDHEEMVHEMTSENRVACWVLQHAEVISFLKPASPACSSVPKQFAKSVGKYDIVTPTFSKEAVAAQWQQISPDKKRTPSTASGKRKQSEGSEERPKKQRQQQGSTSSDASIDTIGLTTVDMPEMSRPGSWWMESGEEAEESIVTQKVVKTFVNLSDEPIRKWFGVVVPPGGTFKVSGETTYPPSV